MANGAISGPGQVDFYSMLGGMGDTLQANRKLQQQQQLSDARKSAFSDFSALDPNSPDYGKSAMTIAQRLGAAGDQEGSMKFIGLAQTAADRQRQAQRDAVSDARWEKSFGLQARAAARADQTVLDKVNERVAVLKANGIDPSTPAGQAYALTGDWAGPTGGGASLTPIYGVDKDGKPAIVQTTKTGQAIQAKLPEGFQIARDPIRVDAGTHINLLDPQTRQVVGTLPKNIADVERQKFLGEDRAKAEAALPGVMASSQQILNTLDSIEKHPGKKWSLGMYSKVPTIPGTDQADFRAVLGQLKGQTFLQAYQQLRGGGAITDVEGAKAEAALLRMDAAQTPEAFDQGMREFRDIVKSGMLRASAKAKMGTQQAQSAPAASTGVAGSGVKWSVD